ncbi:MAG: UDP-N-acetylmuramoyl-L-alanine--D-glutamate ligase [Pseudomonadota bacterium]
MAAYRRWGSDSLVVLTDEPPPATSSLDPEIPWLSAQAALHLIKELDLLVKSPGITPRHPFLTEARNRGVNVTTATNLYLEKVLASGAPVIGITGSKGKSTTATLVHRLLLAAGRKAVLAGNIGTPSLDVLDDVLATGTITVLELSSYQCHDLVLGPNDAVILSLFPEHMDWHGSVEAYYKAKFRIAEHQRKTDRSYYNGAEKILHRHLPLGPAQHIAYNVPEGLHFRDGWFRDGQSLLIKDQHMRLPGDHNRINALAAFAAARPYGAEDQHLESVLAGFEGLPHRLEALGLYQRIRWIDDSISTAPEATRAGIEALSDVDTLIVGGADRGYDFMPLARAIMRSTLRYVILLPPGGAAVGTALGSINCKNEPIKIHEVPDMQEAVVCAAQVTRKGRTCLLSPASPSYGIYRDFIERGEHFRRLVQGLGSRLERR